MSERSSIDADVSSAPSNASELVFEVNRAAASDIARHLRRCNEAFIPPLSRRVDIDVYAAKLAAHAVRFEAWADELVGLLALYCNDPARGTAYMTNVSVLPEWHRRGLGSKLVRSCIAHAQAEEFERIELEVDPANARAIAFYSAKGFVAIGACEARCMMRLRIGNKR